MSIQIRSQTSKNIIPTDFINSKQPKVGAYINYPYKNKPMQTLRNSSFLRTLTYSRLTLMKQNPTYACSLTPQSQNLKDILTITNSKINWKPKGIVKKETKSHRNIYPMDIHHFKQRVLKKYEDLNQCGNVKGLSSNFKIGPSLKKRTESKIVQSNCNSDSCSDNEPAKIKAAEFSIPKVDSNKLSETNFVLYNRQIYLNKISHIRNNSYKLIGSNINSGVKKSEEFNVRPMSLYHSSVIPFRNENCDISKWKQSIDIFPSLLNKMHNEFREVQVKDVEHLKEVFNKNDIPCTANSIERGILLPPQWKIDVRNGFSTPGFNLISKKQLKASSKWVL